MRLGQPTTSGRPVLRHALPLGRLARGQPLRCASIAYDERAPPAGALPQGRPAPRVPRAVAAPVAPAPEPDVDEKERSRRMKISAANRGRTPWNKGRSLPESVREKIRQRTFEAMQRPEVRARMAEANQHRPPHRQEVKDRIRRVLKERVAEAKGVILEHAERIVAAMATSEDPRERAGAARADALDVVCRITWRFMKRDFEHTYDNWAANEGGFRTCMAERFEDLAERGPARRRGGGEGGGAGRRRAPAKTPEGKVRRAVATQKKLIAAKEKLAQAETALANVLPMKAKLAGNPEALAKVNNIEAAVPKLREQVEALTEAMAPLQQYLTPSAADSAAGFVLQQQAAAAGAGAAAGGAGAPVATAQR